MTLSLRCPTHLDDLLNYRLLRLYSASGAPVIRLLEGRFGIARREWRLIALLAAGGPVSPSVLAERAHLDRPRTSRAVGGLVAKRLVERQVQPGYARRAVLALTDAGRRLHDEIFPQVAAINAHVMEAIGDDLARALDEALDRLTAQAVRLNGEIAQDVHADRRGGGSRRVRAWPESSA
jgi:DNA-binding MarR family transcriptional regulator